MKKFDRSAGGEKQKEYLIQSKDYNQSKNGRCSWIVPDWFFFSHLIRNSKRTHKRNCDITPFLILLHFHFVNTVYLPQNCNFSFTYESNAEKKEKVWSIYMILLKFIKINDALYWKGSKINY